MKLEDYEYYRDNSGVLYCGDALDVLKSIQSESVQCCVTSPPYWGLRDYGIEGQLGLEKTPEAYVEKMVEIFKEVRRVLKKDGTLWLNLGDVYAGNSIPGGGDPTVIDRNLGGQKYRQKTVPASLKPKDLIGIPWRVAFALQSDGWYLRSDIIWSKPNPMPESVTDRPTKAHEYIFLMSKSSRYYYDADAIKEPVTGNAHDRGNGVNPKARFPAGWDSGQGSHKEKIGRYPRSKQNESFSSAVTGLVDYRNKRSVWTVATQPFTGWTQTSRLVRVARDELSDDSLHIVSPNCQVHGVLFALLAMAFCGEREVETLTHNDNNENHPALRLFDDYDPSGWLRSYCFGQRNLDSLLPDSEWTATLHNSQNHRKAHALLTSLACTPFSEIASRIDDILAKHGLSEHHRGIVLSNTWPDVMDAHLLDQILHRTVGKSSSVSLRPPCCCPIYKIKTDKTSHFAVFPEKLIEPCILAGCPKGGIVLDPFIGSGTVAAVGKRLGRNYIGIDLKSDYLDMARNRLSQEVFDFTLRSSVSSTGGCTATSQPEV